MIDTYLKRQQDSKMPFLDELATNDGNVFPHWQKLVNYYRKNGEEQLIQKSMEVERLLKENGVTYNIYGDPDGLNRPWNLDPIPLLFSKEDWSVIENGILQRAELLNHILSDLYGSRTLIKKGLIPFELIYNHKGFLRQVDKVKLPGKFQLIQYSTDLARGPDGRMWILHDRTDAPSGAGYALENRATITRVFPDLLRENKVRKISRYFQTLKNTITRLAWQNLENPKTVLLSPGPNNETYFEQAYLASIMGFTLATGEDLMVRDSYVWLKTISGLERVNIIIRRVDDVFCDPLEFREDSKLGVVGLTEVIRQNKVLVVNPLGCRILENPGLLAFLPSLCKEIFGEELLLPSVATWWCGQERERKYVIDNLANLLIRPIYTSENSKAVLGGLLTKDEAGTLKDKILARPHLYVGQEMVDFSTSPALINNQIEARNTVLRTYTVLNYDENKYELMPGGLSRSSPEKGAFIVSNQSGGISKDTWVIGSKVRRKISKSGGVFKVVKADNHLPSSTGENLFWLGRYLERSISTVRFLRISLKKFNESDNNQDYRSNAVVNALLKASTDLTLTYPGFYEDEIIENPAIELIELVKDYNKNGSVTQSLQSFVRNGYKVRDRLSIDIWRILDSISQEIEFFRNMPDDLSQIHQGLDRLIIKLMAFVGINIDTMTREATWHLLNAGRFIETSLCKCRILFSLLIEPYDLEIEKDLLEALLMVEESLISYRYKYRSNIEFSSVLEFLLMEERNPKALVYQIAHCDEHLRKVKNIAPETLSSDRKKLLEIMTMIRLGDINLLSSIKDKERKELKDLLQKIINNLYKISDIISHTYFTHSNQEYAFVNSKLPEL